MIATHLSSIQLILERLLHLQKVKKQQQLLSRLQALVHNADTDSSTTHEVMDYFLKRLSSTQASNRALATKVKLKHLYLTGTSEKIS